MANGGRSLPRLIVVGAATAIGGVLIADQVTSYKARKRKRRLQKAWEAAPDEHRLAAIKVTYPGISIGVIDIALFDEKAAGNLYGV